MSSKYDHPLYSNLLVSIVRVAQFVFLLIVLGITASEFPTWHNSDCKTPSRTIANLAIAALSFPIVVYLLATSGFVNKFVRFLPWNRFVQLGLDLVLVILWLVAGILSKPDCSDLCNACLQFGKDNFNAGNSISYEVWSGSTYCFCYLTGPGFDKKMKLKRGDDIFGSVMSFEKRRSRPSTSSLKSSSKFASKMGFDWLMFIACLAALALTIVFIFFHHQNNNTATVPAAQQGGPDKEHEAAAFAAGTSAGGAAYGGPQYSAPPTGGYPTPPAQQPYYPPTSPPPGQYPAQPGYAAAAPPPGPPPGFAPAGSPVDPNQHHYAGPTPIAPVPQQPYNGPS